MKTATKISPENIEIIEKKIGYTFKNKKILQRAFMHSTMANDLNVESNERLEFFGDAILDFIVSEYLVKSTALLEGDLSVIRASLVSAKSLSDVITELDITQYLLVNKSLIASNIISNNIKCDLFESILGAIYCDGGIENAKKFVINQLDLEHTNFENLTRRNQDYKSPLQELLQAQGEVEIEYRVTNQVGPAHQPTFTISLFINGKEQCSASANSKKEAEQECAKIVYTKLTQD